MAADSFADTVKAYEMLRDSMGTPAIDVRQNPVRWLDKLVLEVVSKPLPVPSSPTVVAGDVATDLATMI